MEGDAIEVRHGLVNVDWRRAGPDQQEDSVCGLGRCGRTPRSVP